MKLAAKALRQNNNVFAMTTINEGILNALLDAIYLNNAPISTRAGGAAEVITDGENGFLVPYGDEEQLTLKQCHQTKAMPSN